MQVIVKKQIHSCFAGPYIEKYGYKIGREIANFVSEDVWIFKGVNLPFAPFVGLTIADGDWSDTIVEVIYKCVEDCFIAYTEDDKEIYNAKLHKENHRSIDEVVKEYLEQGWKLSE